MDRVLNLSNLYSVFKESLDREEPTLSFELTDGRGKFLFIMFFDEKDEKSKDYIFIFLKNSRKMLRIKMYGNHLKGEFNIYIKPFMEQWFIEELNLRNKDNSNPFNLEVFFFNLNNSIPRHLSLASKIDTLRSSWKDIQENLPEDILDDKDKIYLKCPLVLPKNKKPREKTLRKLYLYTDGNANDIADLIEKLKRMNTTVMWTDDERFKEKTINIIKNEL